MVLIPPRDPKNSEERHNAARKRCPLPGGTSSPALLSSHGSPAAGTGAGPRRVAALQRHGPFAALIVWGGRTLTLRENDLERKTGEGVRGKRGSHLVRGARQRVGHAATDTPTRRRLRTRIEKVRRENVIIFSTRGGGSKQQVVQPREGAPARSKHGPRRCLHRRSEMGATGNGGTISEELTHF